MVTGLAQVTLSGGWVVEPEVKCRCPSCQAKFIPVVLPLVVVRPMLWSSLGGKAEWSMGFLGD